MVRTGLLGAGWGAFYGLCVGWMYFAQPDWMLVYLVDSKGVPLVPSYLLFVVLLAVHGAVGGFSGAALVSRGRSGLAWLLVLGALLSVGAAGALQWRQYYLLGSYQQFHAGTAAPISSVESVQLPLTLIGILGAGSAVGLLAMRFIKGRRAARSPAKGSAA